MKREDITTALVLESDLEKYESLAADLQGARLVGFLLERPGQPAQVRRFSPDMDLEELRTHAVAACMMRCEIIGLKIRDL